MPEGIGEAGCRLRQARLRQVAEQYRARGWPVKDCPQTRQWDTKREDPSGAAADSVEEFWVSAAAAEAWVLADAEEGGVKSAVLR